MYAAQQNKYFLDQHGYKHQINNWHSAVLQGLLGPQYTTEFMALCLLNMPLFISFFVLVYFSLIFSIVVQ